MKGNLGCIRSFRLNGCGPAAARTYSEWIARGLDFHHHRSHALYGLHQRFHDCERSRSWRGLAPSWSTVVAGGGTLLNTAALVVSGLALIVTEIVFRRNAKAAIIPFFVSLVLGGWFVVAQGIEWAALLEQGLTLTSSAHGAFFYTIVGFHGIHVIVSLGILIFCFVRLVMGTMTAGQLWVPKRSGISSSESGR